MNTSTISALSEGSESGLGEEMACKKKIGRNTDWLAVVLRSEVDSSYIC